MRNGFTMVELIFTILILAVTTMAIPHMVAQTAELNIFAIKQELVMNAKTLLTQMSKTPWDSAYKMVVCNESGGVLEETAKINNANACEKPIHIHEIPGGNADINTRFYNSSSNRDMVADIGGNLRKDIGKSSYGVVGGYNDLDDYNGYKQTMKPIRDIAGGNTTGDYLLDTGITVTVGFVSDAVLNAGQSYATSNQLDATLNTAIVAGPTNIKLIQITASDINDPTRNVVLRSYSFNIGSSAIALNERH